jgi:hypothetical protein
VLDINKGDDTIDWIGQGALHRPFSSSNRHPHHANGDFLPGMSSFGLFENISFLL